MTAALERPVLDARLVVAAVLCWVVTAIGMLSSWQVASVPAGLLLGIGLTGLWFRSRLDVLLNTLTAAALLGAGVGASVAIRVHTVMTHPLAGMADGARVVATVILTEDPNRLRGSVFGDQPQIRATARLIEVRSRGQVLLGAGRVQVSARESGWSGLLPGTRIRLSATVHAPRRNDLSVAMLRVHGPPDVVGAPPWWQRSAGALRHGLREAAARALPSEPAGLLPAMAIGDTTGESDQVVEMFRAAGLAHLTAVSGGNLQILLTGVQLLCRRSSLGRRAGVAAALIALVGFVVLARPQPSVLRAAAMGLVSISAQAVGRPRQLLPALCAAVVVLIGLFPELALDIGFMLSVAATAALVLLAPGGQRWLCRRGLPAPIAAAVAVAVSAFAVTAPIVVLVSGTANPMSILANVAVSAVVAPITMLGLLSAVTAVIWPPGAAALAAVTAPLLWWLLRVAQWTAGVTT